MPFRFVPSPIRCLPQAAARAAAGGASGPHARLDAARRARSDRMAEARAAHEAQAQLSYRSRHSQALAARAGREEERPRHGLFPHARADQTRITIHNDPTALGMSIPSARRQPEASPMERVPRDAGAPPPRPFMQRRAPSPPPQRGSHSWQAATSALALAA